PAAGAGRPADAVHDGHDDERAGAADRPGGRGAGIHGCRGRAAGARGMGRWRGLVGAGRRQEASCRIILGSMRVLLSLAATAFAVTSSLCSQTYITGKVQKAPNVRCDATATHILECTDVLLKSSAVHLTTWEGK